jgi:hypothetical protein
MNHIPGVALLEVVPDRDQAAGEALWQVLPAAVRVRQCGLSAASASPRNELSTTSAWRFGPQHCGGFSNRVGWCASLYLVQSSDSFAVVRYPEARFGLVGGMGWMVACTMGRVTCGGLF